MAEEYDDSYRMNDAPIDPETGDYLVTFEGRRRVLGGLGTGTPDGFAPFATYAFDFFTEDMITMVHPDSTIDERALAAGFTFIKLLKMLILGMIW